MVDYTPQQKRQLLEANRRIDEYRFNLRISFFKRALRVVFFPFVFLFEFVSLFLLLFADFWKQILFFVLLFFVFSLGKGDLSFVFILLIAFLIGSGGRF